MDWSYGQNGRLINEKESRNPESGAKSEARKTKIAMGGLHYGKSGRRM